MSAKTKTRTTNGCTLVTVLLLGASVACTSSGKANAKRPATEADGSIAGGVSVLQHHNHASRDGVYVDPALTKPATQSLHMDSAFAGATVEGPTYAQPLYLAGVDRTPDLVIVATEQNDVVAFNAANGGKVWSRTLGTPVPISDLPCGNIDPLGVTGTPVIDGETRTIFLDAMISSGGAAHHRVFALDADTGTPRSGWPVDLNATAAAGATRFDSLVQNQRGALLLHDGSVFVPFGGHFGDCGSYHGWVVGISVADPTRVSAWATRAIAGGVWAPGGIASDGTSLFFATGNTESAPDNFSAPPTWQDGDAIFRLPPSLTFSGNEDDYFVPSDWQALDDSDADLGGSNPIVVEDPGATPQHLVVGLGKNGRAYVLDRDHLGGIGMPLAGAQVSQSSIINAPAAYTTASGTYVVFKGPGQDCPGGQSGGLTAIRISESAPPTVSVAWCAGPQTQASPAVSMTDDQGSNAVVWIVGRDDKLYGLDGDTGATVYDGGSTAMSSVQKFQTPIIVGGRIFVAANDHVYAYTP